MHELTQPRERPAPHAPTIAIVGGGFSGAMILANLLRAHDPAGDPLHVLLFERRPAIGEGIAYHTTDARHLLNVPAKKMSAWPDRPDHFSTYASSHDPALTPDAFAPRALYGAYVREIVTREAQAAPANITARIVHDDVVRLDRSRPGWDVVTASGTHHAAAVAILAVGHRPPEDPLADAWRGPRTRFLADPWDVAAITRIGADEPVLLIGSGLTAVDVMLTLHARERRAPIVAVSRRGLVPTAHLRDAPPPPDAGLLLAAWLDPARELTSAHLTQTFRRYVRAAADAGIPWQSALDALRPAIPALWGRLGARERRRFVRHVRPYWEVHRHRLAPSIAETLALFLRERHVRVVAANIVAARGDDDGVDVTICARADTTLETRRFAWVVNCTGPGAHHRHTTHPVLRPLLAAGVACVDELGLGLLTDDDGCTIEADGRRHETLLVAGTLRKATRWESTAVPELSVQARDVARAARTALAHTLTPERDHGTLRAR